MSISDRLDEIEQHVNDHNPATGEESDYMVLAHHAPALVAALRAVLDLCDKALAVKVSGSTEGDAAMAAFAAATLSAITAALGEES